MSVSPSSNSDIRAAQALTRVIGNNSWEVVALAYGYLAILEGKSDQEAARIAFDASGSQSIKKYKEFLQQSRTLGFLRQLEPRKKTGSAENPITKLFPATVTEQRFMELLDELCNKRPGLHYSDDRKTGHTLSDFTLKEGELKLPINIKNAGTRFEQAQKLVHIDPNDCIPIPVYKAQAAVESLPSLLYVISVDYDLIKTLNALLPQILNEDEIIVWDLLGNFSGSHVRKAEDEFIFTIVQRHWQQFKKVVQNNPFHVVSAKRSIQILHELPKRTPGIGLRAWGTSARAEVNVHLSIKEDTTPWDIVRERIRSNGIINILDAVNRTKIQEVYNPEI
jgi:hypothetical protein